MTVSVLAFVALQPMQAAAPVLIQNVRIIARPGAAPTMGSILIRDGKIAQIGASVTASGAEIVDAHGLTAYPGLIHPYYSEAITGIGASGAAATPPGEDGGRPQRPQNQSATDQAEAQRKRDADPFGRETNLQSQISLAEIKDKELSGFESLAKNGYAIAQANATAGLVTPASGLFDLGSNKLNGTAMGNPGAIAFRFNTRGFNSYPSSTMGAIAFIRQALCDAQAAKPNAPAALLKLQKVVNGAAYGVFDDLNEVSFFEAQKIAKEFGLKPIYGFRQDAGAVADLLKSNSVAVTLKGVIPVKPSIGVDLSAASLSAVRTYFNEIQAGAELEKLGIAFCYAPGSSSSPLDGIRTYVRGGLSRTTALAAMTTRPAQLLHIDDRAGSLEVGKLGNVLLVQGDLFDSSSQIMANFIQGKRVKFDMPARKTDSDLKADAPIQTLPVNHQLFPAPAETDAAYRLYRNATISTEGPEGTLKNADLLIQNGKIVKVGHKIAAPDGCQVVDATGKFISPGIWDCHSHTGINGGVNEGTNMITVECRIADVIDHKSNNIYLQLSGGTVGAQQLHGSANAIGGQTSPVKWRWGLRPTDFPIEGAPQGVKFALGQNPIREDASGGGGFGGQQPPVGATLLTFRPRTRMGVEEAIRRALQLGKEYNQAWDDYRSGKRKEAPRRDLQLEGLGEIAAGKRLIHSHGYRADELLMLVRVTKEFGAKIATLQHVLEGYKIADEMAAEGIGGSTFSDWWGYKLEAYDAIPYNAALMAERGVSVSINSDSDNHARRLNQEAAKSMRYGGVSAEKALSFVTIEPARQMGIASHTGSLEPGKDADFVVWSTEPTSIFAVCLETYVDGVKRFDRANDAAQRIARDEELGQARKALSATSSDSNNPFDTGSGPSAGAKANSVDGAKMPRAKYGIGPLTGNSASLRYPRKATLITGAMIHPMDGEPYIGDVLLGADGKIAEVGKRVDGFGAQKVDGRKKHVYPGLIDPATGIGLNEIGQVPASDDSSERGAFHPDYRVERAINPEWETMGVARQQGILTALVKPSGSGISGQAALIQTEGYTWEDLTIQGGVGLVFSTGGGGFDFGMGRFDDACDDVEALDDLELTSGQGRGGQAGPSASLEALSKQLEDARDYRRKRDAATPEKPFEVDLKQEAMLLAADGKLPVILSANTAQEIKQAVQWSDKEGVRIVLYGCTGAGDIADWLAANQTPICLAAVYNMPRADQPVDYFYNLPAKLTKAGVKFCLTTNNDKDVRQIRDQAGWAAAYGLDREEAARLITLRAAETLGVADRLGALKAGLDGTVLLTDGEIIETKTKVLRAWIQSREVDLTNRQTRLYDKYRARPKAVVKR